MKIIDVQWGNLYPGYQLVKRLDDRLNGRSSQNNPAVRFDAEPSHKPVDESQTKLTKQPLRVEFSAREEAEYQRRLNKEYEKFMAYLVVGGALGIAFLCTLVGIPVAVLIGYLIYRQFRVYEGVRYERTGKPPVKVKLRPSRAHPNAVQKDPTNTKSILLPQWWEKLEEADPKTQRERTHGTAGVEALVDLLEANLSDDYIVVRELLVRGGLDADVVLLGPKGIWVLECKNWSGEIICKNGEWSQSKEYVKSRGKHDKKITDHPRGPDLQWIQERDNLAQTLQRRLPNFKWLTSFIFGGIVFTIPEVDLSIDSTCRTEVGKPIYWLRRIQKSPDVPRFTLDIQLQVIDALTSFAGRYEEGVGTQSTETLANQLFQSALAMKEAEPTKKGVMRKAPVN